MSLSIKNRENLLLAGIKKDLFGAIEKIKYYRVKEN
jgi:hypothetical protein